MSVISQAEAAEVGAGQGAGKINEEYKNKMAWTPGTGSRLSEVLGNGTRIPSSSPIHCHLLVSRVENYFLVMEGGCCGKEQGKQTGAEDKQGMAGRKPWKESERGVKRKPEAVIGCDPIQFHLIPRLIQTDILCY